MGVQRRSRRLWSFAVCGTVVALMVGLLSFSLGFSATTLTGFSTADRIDMRVLVIDDGSPWVDGLAQQMATEGIPYTSVVLSSSTRPTITAAFLSSGTEAFFQGIIMPNETGGSLTAAEMSAITAYEAQFGIRQVDAFTFANPNVGLNYAQNPGYIGALDGMTGTVTAPGQADGFGYLAGSLPFGVGSYAYLATPLSPMPAGASFTPYVTVPIPNTTSVGSMMGDYAHDGRDELVITAAMSYYQFQFRALAHGIVSWVTRGVHMGYNRQYFTMHFDDAFNSDARWDVAHDCTPGEDCPRNPDGSSIYTTPDIVMSAADVAFATQWEQQNNYTFTLAFNGFYADPTSTLTAALVASKGSFKWLNHGYEHIFQGCVQDFTVIPWRCTTDASGNIVWVSQADISNEINNNITTGQTLGLPFDPKEYLSGEHSGLFILPQQPVDNPNFVAAITANGITAIGADASREPGARQVGSALTVPRHPVAIYYNTGHVSEEVSEYNWFYTSRANGGSGYCDDNPTVATCITPLDPATGFQGYIVPTDAANDLSFIMNNDPRPFYAHVSNLAEDRIAYPLMSSILGTYRSTYKASAPVLNLTLTQASQALQRQSAWASVLGAATPPVTGYIQGGSVHITGSTTAAVPVTAPPGTTVNGQPFGESYGGEQSAWLSLGSGINLGLPTGSYYTVTVSPNVKLSPTSLNFGSVVTGVTSTAMPVTLTNSGNAALAVGGVTTTAEFAQTNNCPTSLAAGASCSINVTFTPAARGPRTGTLSVTDSAPGSPHTVPLSGTGAATSPGISISPSSLAFGNQAVNTASAARPVTVTNTGTAPLSISGVAINGNYSQTNTCPASLTPKATCTINVTFKPAATGTRTGTLSVTDNASGSPHRVTLTGTGLGPVASLSPTSVNMAGVVGNPAPVNVTLRDTGNAPLLITGITISGSTRLTQTNNCPASLAAGASCTITVRYTGPSFSSATATLSVADNAPGSPHKVSLRGSRTL